MAVPDTRYARRPDGVNIGYQTLGRRETALVWCWGWMSHLDLQWGEPGLARLFERLAGGGSTPSAPRAAMPSRRPTPQPAT